jgi:hypothetical protein
MLSIKTAVIRFDIKYGRLPATVVEIVSVGLLPEKSEVFASPLRSGWLWPSAVDVNAIQFQVAFAADKFTISDGSHLSEVHYQGTVKDVTLK